MGILDLIILSIGLSMDAVAVSFACSICHTKALKRHLLKAAFLFGLFQAVMPLIGYTFGLSFRNFIQGFDHWIAFVLLAIVGGKMLFDNDEEDDTTIYSFRKLLILAVATSIDALVVGITFGFIKVNLLESVLVIGLVTAILSFLAGFLGKQLAHFNQKYFKIAGGVAIIGIGIKILLSHLLG